jgi:hypothetical protein
MWMLEGLQSSVKCDHLRATISSILEMRSCPIHFHFVVDAISEKVINSLFLDDILLDYMQYDFYDDALIVERQRPLLQLKKHTEHGKGEWHFIKALRRASPELLDLPPHITNVMLLDFDILLIRDICPMYYDLQHQLEGDNKPAALLAPDMSAMYARVGALRRFISDQTRIPDEHRWSDSFFGMNSGVVFVNLTAMRFMNWTSTYIDLMTHNSFASIADLLRLPEQNIFNMMAVASNLTAVQYMSPAYNFQLFTSHPRLWRRLYRDRWGTDNITIMHGNAGTISQMQSWIDHFLNASNDADSCYYERKHISDYIKV